MGKELLLHDTGNGEQFLLLLGLWVPGAWGCMQKNTNEMGKFIENTTLLRMW